MANLGTLRVFLTADTSKYRKGMSRAQALSVKFANTVRNASIAGGAALSALGVRAVQLSARQEKAERQLAATLRATGFAAGFTTDQLKAYASELQSSTSVADDEILKTISIMTTFRNVSGATFKESISLATDMSAVLGQSLQSSAVQLGKALNDPIRGMTALQRVGITFTDSQKEMIKSLQESGDLLGAQEVILQELRMQFQGAAAEMANAEPWKRLTNAISDALEGIGTIIKEALSLDKVFGDMGDTVGDWGNKIKSVSSELGFAIKTVLVEVEFGFRKAIAFGTTWGEMLINTFRLIARAVKGVTVFMWENFKQAFTMIADAATETGKAIWNKLKNPFSEFKLDLANIRGEFVKLSIDTSGLEVDTERVLRVEKERQKVLKEINDEYRDSVMKKAEEAHKERELVKSAKERVAMEQAKPEDPTPEAVAKPENRLARALQAGTREAFNLMVRGADSKSDKREKMNLKANQMTANDIRDIVTNGITLKSVGIVERV